MQAVVNIEYFNIIIDYKQRSWEIKLSPESCSDPAFNNVQYKKKFEQHVFIWNLHRNYLLGHSEF